MPDNSLYTVSSALPKPSDSNIEQKRRHLDRPAAPQGASNNLRSYQPSQIYRAISEINQAILNTTDKHELFHLACQFAVDFIGVNMAWVGVADLKSECIVPIVSFGRDTDYLRNIQIATSHKKAEGCGPAALAYRNNQPVIINNWLSNPLTAPWHIQANNFNWGSGSSFAIQRHGQPFAVLSTYHSAENFFDNETAALLNEVARSISFALGNLDHEQQRHDALEALRADQQHLRAFFQLSMFGMTATHPDKTWLEVNQALCTMLGYSAEELLHTSWDAITHPDDLQASNTLFQQLFDGCIDEFALKKRFIKKSGGLVDVHLTVRAVRDAEGNLAYAAALIEDISHSKMAERREKMRQHTLDKIARGDSLDDIMTYVIESTEALSPESMCSILLTDVEAKHLLSGAAPSLPAFFSKAIHGIAIDTSAGSCAAAISLKKRIIVADIASHPYWKKHKDLAAAAGLAACWSEPIHSKSASVLGSFAIYRRTPSVPDDQEVALLESAASLLSIAIESIRTEEELYLASSIYNNSTEAVLLIDANKKIIALNPTFRKITGYSLKDLHNQDTFMLLSDRHTNDFFQSIWKEVDERSFWQGQIWNRRKNDETFPAWVTINSIRDAKGEIQHYTIMASDITNKVRSDELIWHQANYDFLTKLPNRYMFQDRLEQEVRKSIQHDLLLALLFIDLDHFKDVNDTLGHAAGDQLLVQAAERINTCIRNGDTVARMSGDEFTVILPKLNTILEAEKVAARIIAVLAEPYCLNNKTIYAQASIGIAFCPTDTSQAGQLIRSADQAMYAAKTAGRNRLSYFTQSLHDEAQNRLKLLNDLHSALSKQQFELYFQPIIDLSSGRISKAEALIRWNHPELGMVSPAEFIPLAEETDLIVKIGNWVFQEAASAAKRWRDVFNDGLQVSLNVSPVQFQSDALKVSQWLDYLQKIGLETQYINIEITEGLLLNASDNVKNKLLQFRHAGIQIAIDDFGIGYSALSYLRRFHIDYLKIDQFFIKNIETDHNNRVLSEVITIMAHKLGLQVIAEGIETEAQQDLLQELGCDYGQGYFFSRPLPVAEFEAFMISAGQTEQ